MGGTQSMVPAPDPSQPYFALFFHKPDRIKIVLADKETVEIIRSACLNTWSRGFQEDCYHEDGSYHLKFAGNPFWKAGSLEDAIGAKTVAISILINLYAAGWDFLLSSDLTRYEDLTTWFFQRVAHGGRPVNRSSMFCLSLSSTDCLQLIGADESMAEILKYAVRLSYAPGIQDDRCHQIGSGCCELKLYGTPWRTACMTEGVQARKMLLEIIRQFHARRYRLYATADLKGTADCLFFIQTGGDTMPDKFCMISLNANDRLRLIDCPADVIEATKQTIISSWSGGLQNEYNLGNDGNRSQTSHASYLETPAWEFQMRGYPWWANGSDTVRSRAFLTTLFTNLLQRGWAVVSALDISRRDNDKAVFVLRSCPPIQLPHFCLSLNETDKIRLIGARPDIVDGVRRTILHIWPKGIDRECDYHGSIEFKLCGNPWSPFTSNESCLAKVMMCRLLATFAQHGWRVISSADVSAKYVHQDKGPDYPIDVHSWFVAYTGFTQQAVPPQIANQVSAPPLPGTVPFSGFDMQPPSYSEATK